MARQIYCEIGPHAQIDDDVLLGYRFEGDSAPLKIGAYAVIRAGSILYADTSIGERFSCGHQTLIRGGILIGDRVVVHHKVTLEGNLRIGSGVKIMAHVYIPSRTCIGNMVFIGPNVTILNDKFPMRTKTMLRGVTIEDHVTIGGGATVCPGIAIGARSFIAAGAVVTKNVPPDTLVIGSPGRFQPLDESLARGNLPENMLPQTDLFGAHSDESWRNP